MSIYSRYLLAQIARPMITAILVALIALLAERTLRVIDLVVGWRGSLFVVFEMLGYLIPHYMGLALPVAFFLGILLTFSRLSREGELAAHVRLGRRPAAAAAADPGGLHRPRGRRGAAGQPAAALCPLRLSRRDLRADQCLVHHAAAETACSRRSATRPTWSSISPTTNRRWRRVFLYQGEAGERHRRRSRPPPGMPSGAARPSRSCSSCRTACSSWCRAGKRPTRRARGEVVIRFREFETTLANPDDDFRPRGEDEREMTLLELWAATGNPPPQVDPWEIHSELDGRLVRILIAAGAAADGDPAGDRPGARPALLRAGRRPGHADRLPPAAPGRRSPGRQQQAPDLARAVGAVRRVRADLARDVRAARATRVPDPRLGIWLDRAVRSAGPAAAAAPQSRRRRG